ncbi:hypothetical protein GCM10010171_57280 [Actinokineospora fastidiosa]|uniref:Uncharacterized protein n=1 Tax=Actinokineospora fastidiosa TaxID=1816 RepID=A0A918GSK6_9PSEU|nr:hypothetical protein GCM10010171_57280 [Actinokineospora fastidiosa]
MDLDKLEELSNLELDDTEARSSWSCFETINNLADELIPMPRTIANGGPARDRHHDGPGAAAEWSGSTRTLPLRCRQYPL